MMRTTLALLAAAILVGQVPEPQRNDETGFIMQMPVAAQAHPEPPVLPAGQFCVHATTREPNPAHPCACQGECMPNIEIGDDGKPHETITVKEDSSCKQYCHYDHCHCPKKGCE